MPRLSLSELGSSQPLELEQLEPRELLSGNPLVAQVREMTWNTMAADTGSGNLYRSDTDGTWIVGAYQNGTVEVRSAATNAVERSMQTGVGRAYAVTVDNGIAYVSAGTNAGGCVIAWDCATGEKLWQRNLGNNANAIGIQDGVIGVDVDYKGTMQIDAASGNVLAGGDPEGYYGTVVTKGIVVYARAGNQVWLDDNGSRRMLASGGGNITARIAVSPDGQFIAVGRSNGGVELRSADGWNVVGTAGVNGAVSSIGWSVTGKTLLVGSASGEVAEWTAGEDGTLTEAGRTNTGRMVFAVDEVNGAVFAQAGDSAAVWRELPLWEERVAEVVAEEEQVVSAEASDAVFAEMATEGDTEEVTTTAMLASLESSLQDHGLELPPMQRRVKEIDRELTQQQSALNAAQGELDNAEAYVARIQQELRDVNTALNDARRRDDGGAVQRLDSDRMNLEKILVNAYARKDAATAKRDACIVACDTLCNERADLIVAIATCEDGIRSDTSTWMMLQILDGMSADDAEAGARTMVDVALQEGFDAMPHVKPLVSILDTNMASSYDGGAMWIGTVTEVQEHKSPVLTRDGGALRILGRVKNNGDRAGWITVEGTGVSDLVTNPSIQQRLEVFLSPGESRDFAMTIAVPGGTERAGSISLRAITPDEDMVRNDKLVQQPKGTMDVYRQGIDAVAHNTRSILLSPGGTGSAQARVENYLATKPSEAAVLIAEARSGKNVLDAQTTASLIAAGNSPVVTVAMAQKEETMNRVFGTSAIPLNWFAMAGMNDSDPWFDEQLHGAAPELSAFLAMQQAISWYTGTVPSGMTVRTDTVVGRMAAGLATEAVDADPTQQQILAVTLQQATGITVERTLSALRTSADRRAAAIQRLFTGNGYSMIEAPEDSTIRASTDKTTYDVGTMRVSFDIPSGKTIARAMLIPSGIAANQELPTAFVLGQTTSRTFIDVDVTKLRQLMIQGANVSLTVRLEMTDGSVILEETNGFEVGILQQSSPAFDVQTIVGEAWNSLSKMQQEHITAALDFPDLNNLPSGNQAILNYLINTFLLTTDSATRLQYDNPNEFEGAAHGTGLMQCKEWLQQVVIKQATGITVSGNAEITTGAWMKSDYEIGRMANGEVFQDMLDRVGAKAGDVVQMYVETQETSFPHTMVIGKITNEGVWVFDTNFGTNDEWKTMDEGTGLDLSGETMGYYDEQTGNIRVLTKEDIANGAVPNRWRQPDNTVRYHFLSYEKLNIEVQSSTLQRISSVSTTA